jgi:DNA-binding IclR family transcriptional regulator
MLKHPSASMQTDKAATKIIELLEALTESDRGFGLHYLAGCIKIPRTTTAILLNSLCKNGLVEFDEKLAVYRLGLYSVALAQKMLMKTSVIAYAHPILEELVRKHGESVYMAVPRAHEVLFLDMVNCSSQPTESESLVGRRVPFFTNAAGKVMKALDSYDLLKKLVRKYRRQNDELPDLQQLDTELEQIRSSGVAIDNGGLGEGLISVAVAVRDYGGKVVGAITLIGPSFRLLSERLETEIIPSLTEGAELLSKKFGYTREVYA